MVGLAIQIVAFMVVAGGIVVALGAVIGLIDCWIMEPLFGGESKSVALARPIMVARVLTLAEREAAIQQFKWATGRE